MTCHCENERSYRNTEYHTHRLWRDSSVYCSAPPIFYDVINQTGPSAIQKKREGEKKCSALILKAMRTGSRDKFLFFFWPNMLKISIEWKRKKIVFFAIFQLPSQVAAVLRSPFLQHIVSCHRQQHVMQRLNFWLYQVLSEGMYVSHKDQSLALCFPILKHVVLCHRQQHVMQRLNFWLYQVLSEGMYVSHKDQSLALCFPILKHVVLCHRQQLVMQRLNCWLYQVVSEGMLWPTRISPWPFAFPSYTT